jgi:hypothetical protein
MRSLSVLTTFFCIAALQLPGRAEPDKVLAAAQALLAKDRVKDAETILAKAIEADGAQFQLRKLLAEVLSHQGELEKAALLMEAGSWLEKATDDEKMRAWWMARMAQTASVREEQSPFLLAKFPMKKSRHGPKPSIPWPPRTGANSTSLSRSTSEVRSA